MDLKLLTMIFFFRNLALAAMLLLAQPSLLYGATSDGLLLQSSDAFEVNSFFSNPWFKVTDTKWGGYVKLRGMTSWIDDESLYQPVGAQAYYDGSAEGRLKSEVYLGKRAYFQTHYEVLWAGGDTRRKSKELERLFPGLFNAGRLFEYSIEDDRRFMDLTKVISESDSWIFYHRLDRLFLSILLDWSLVTIGRQAVTWGNGLLFNPMDLFNPFSPTDIERDYKIGDDLVSVQFSAKKIGDFQILYVPRRNPKDRDLEWNRSSLAGKFHFAWGTTEFEIMGARHFHDDIIGFGSRGYLGDAAWRLDAVWSFLNATEDRSNYLSLVTSLDYSWMWWSKNWYGFVEIFYNGFGSNDYAEALVDSNVRERIERGELFTLGRAYLGAHFRIELHPLFNAFITVINNAFDPSGVIQPRAIWDLSQNLLVTFGGSILYGGSETEFGGFRIPGTNLLYQAPNSAFIWLTYHF